MEQVVRWNSAGTPSFQNVVFLVVIILALLLQKGSLSRAKAGITSSWSATGVVKPTPLALRKLPEVRFVKLGLVLLVAAAMIFIPQGWSASSQLTAAFAIIWAMVGVSLVVLTGWGGNISLGQFGIVGVGAVVAGNLVAKTELDLFIALLLAGLAGAAIALIVGLPALRISGLFLAVTTLAFAVALNSYFFNPDQFGSLLPRNVVRPFLWERFDLESNYAMYLFCLAFVALSVLASMGVRKARAGRVVIGARDNQRAADAAAVPTTNVKLSAFIPSGVIAGMAGGLHVLCLHALGQNTYSPVDSLTVFCTAVIGGLGSLGGAILGVLVFRWLETITALGDLRLLITGTGLLVVLYALPGGFGQLMLNLRDRYLRWVANRHGILVPTLVADKRADEGDDALEEHAPKEAALLESALSDEVSEEAAQEADDLLGAGR
jgi:branched-chain amino acid transport system permease protein